MSKLKIAVNASEHHQGYMNAPLTIFACGNIRCPQFKCTHPFIKRLFDEMGKDLLYVNRNFALRQIHLDAIIDGGHAGKEFAKDLRNKAIQNNIEKKFEGRFCSGVNATPACAFNDSPALTYTTTYKSFREDAWLELELL